MGIFNEQSFDHPFAKGIQGAPGVGFRLTSDGNFDISGKKLTNVGAPSSNTDAATKKYVDDKSASSSGGGASKSSTLTIDSNIDMKDRFRILNLKSPLDADEPATKHWADSTFLDRGGNRGMIANLVLNSHKITQLGAPTANTDAATKKYVDDVGASTLSSANSPRNINMQNSYRITNLPAPLDAHEPPTKSYVDNTFLERDGSYPMTGDLKMGSHKITALRTPTSSTDAATKKYVDENIPDTSSFIKKDGSVAMTGDFSTGGHKILNLRTPTSNSEPATKKYVDDNIVAPDLSDYLEKDGTVAMTGNLKMGSNRIVSLAEPTNPSDSANMSWVKKQIQHFDVISSPVFTVTAAPAYITVYLQHQGGRFVFTTSKPGLPLVSWKPASGIYLNKIVFNFNRSINVKKISFVARDSSTANVDFWVSEVHTGIWSLNIHRTWSYEMSGVFLDYVTDANSNHAPITSNIYTGKPSATTRDFSKITFNVPTDFISSVTATNPTTSSQVATKAYVDKSVSGPAHYRNVFKFLMESASQWTDEITTRTSFVIKKIGDLDPNIGNFHSYNHRAVYLGLKKYSGGYKFKIGVNFYSLPVGDYTICFELLNTDYTLWHKTQIEVDHRTSSGLTFLSESVKKHTYSYYYPTNNLNYMYYHRVIVSFTKANAGRSFFHITVNIPEVGNDMNSYPSEFTKFYVIVYGISGAHGNVDPDRSFDYHTAFDIQPTQVVYNVGINANNKAITNLAIDQNTNSAATFGMIKDLRNLLPLYFYEQLFEEFWDFTHANNYVLLPTSSNTNITTNKLKSIKGTSTITFPTKNLSHIKNNGLNVNNYTLDIPLSDNITNLNLFIVYYYWFNRDFSIIRYNTQNNTKLFEITYNNTNRRVTIKSGLVSSFGTVPGYLSGKKVVVWIKQTQSYFLQLYINNIRINIATGYGTINSTKQKVTFLTMDGVVNKIMFTSNMSQNNYKILMQENLIV